MLKGREGGYVLFYLFSPQWKVKLQGVLGGEGGVLTHILVRFTFVQGGNAGGNGEGGDTSHFSLIHLRVGYQCNGGKLNRQQHGTIKRGPG